MKRKDPFRITFLGAAGTVTGSMHLLEAGEGSYLVDCGLYQGRRGDANHRNRHLSRQAVEADALLLTHAHIDHSGSIPTLVKRGFEGKVHCTYATADLCEYMLRDSGRIQENDARWLNRKYGKEPGWVPIEPIYTEADAEDALKRLVAHPYDEPFEVGKGVSTYFIDAGHVLGSSSVIVDVKLKEHRRRVAFSGDIGRRNLPILRDPQPPEHADYVVMETTYGDRVHADAQAMQDQLLDAIETARKRNGKIVIPSFALERTQEVVYALNDLRKSGRLDPIPVYVDSPLAVGLTEAFRRHPECYDSETIAFDNEHGDPFDFPSLTLVRSAEESKALNDRPGPMIIVSAAGMCEAGRVVHHLRNTVENFDNMVVIVGYQAQHTVGRRIVERRKRIKILGVERDLNAEVRVLNAFSAHADRDELLWWAESCGRQVRTFFLVHGDPDQTEAFAGHLESRNLKAHIAVEGKSVDLDY